MSQTIRSCFFDFVLHSPPHRWDLCEPCRYVYLEVVTGAEGLFDVFKKPVEGAKKDGFFGFTTGALPTSENALKVMKIKKFHLVFRGFIDLLVEFHHMFHGKKGLQKIPCVPFLAS